MGWIVDCIDFFKLLLTHKLIEIGIKLIINKQRSTKQISFEPKYWASI
jgi:hypothetical protein